MFTGIIEATAGVLSWDGSTLVITRPPSFDDLKVGSSICVQGVCLSVTTLDKHAIHFSVVPETIEKSTLGSLKKAERVNLERAIKADSRLDGHIVQGHVEGVGKVVAINSSIPRPLPPQEEGEKYVKNPLGSLMRWFVRSMRKNPTLAEAKLWKYLRNDQMGVRFRRQYPMGGRILDFYCPTLKIAIEVDGGIHQDAFQKKDDRERDQFLFEEYKIHTLRFSNDQILNHSSAAIRTIKETIQKHSPPPVEEGIGVEEYYGVKEGLGAGEKSVEEGLGVEEYYGLQRELGVEVEIEIPTELAAAIQPKGSIAIDGVSLTVADIHDHRIRIALIPLTRSETTLGTLATGDRVNIETDILARRGMMHPSV